MRAFLISSIGPFPSESERISVSEDARARLIADGWTPPPGPYEHVLVLTKAEVVHLATDLAADTRAKRGPRLSGPLKVIAASAEIVRELEAGTIEQAASL